VVIYRLADILQRQHRVTPMKRLVLLVALSMPSVLLAQGSFTAASCNRSDVNAVINGRRHVAVDGDTINVPSGACTWTSGITITKAITIISISGAASTTINVNFNVSGSALFVFRPTTAQIGSGKLTRVSGFTLQPLAGLTAVSPAINAQGACNSSTCTNIRVDNNVFSGWANVTKANNGYGINVMGDMFGVLDHNTFNGGTSDNQYNQAVEVSHASFPNPAKNGSFGDSSWNQPEGYGSANFLFFEDNTFNQTACCENEARTIDYPNEGGARVVLRFNQSVMDHLNVGITWHGTESNGRPRGGRVWEAYANNVSCNSVTYHECPAYIAIRSGTGMTWGNGINTSLTTDGITSMSTNRSFSSIGGWGACDGGTVYDTNDPTVYWAGTVGTVSGQTVTVNTTTSGPAPPWATNGWINGTIAANCNAGSPPGSPCSLHDVTTPNGSELTANGSNTLTFHAGAIGAFTPAPGDTIQILRATACIDQGGGRGAGFLYSGWPNPPNTTQQVSSAQVASPMYAWANPVTNAALLRAYVFSFTARVIQNRDWFQDNVNQSAQTSPTSPFNGTVTSGSTTNGTGYGTLANRPATCTTGVAYWATDDPAGQAWNTNHRAIPGIPSRSNGALYICGASGWPASASYVPYTYPHPLVSQPLITISPTLFAFGNVPQGTASSPITGTVKNNSSSSIMLNSTYFTITGTNAADFANTGSLTMPCQNNLVLAAGATCLLAITFTPSTGGAESATLTVNSSVGAATASLMGTGTRATLSVSPSSFNFGNVNVGSTSAAQTFTLTNTGTGTLTGLFQNQVLNDLTNYSIINNTCGTTIGASGGCTFQVTFHPTVGGLINATQHHRLKPMKHNLTLDHVKKEARDLLRGLQRRDPEALRQRWGLNCTLPRGFESSGGVAHPSAYVF